MDLTASFESLYADHIEQLIERYRTIMRTMEYDYLVIPSGEPKRQHLDDMYYPFKPNPHFKAVVPLIDIPFSCLVFSPDEKPVLIYYQPVDFWHKVAEDPAGYWADHFDIRIIRKPAELVSQLPKELGRAALLSETPSHLLPEVSFRDINPEPLVARLDWDRAYKTAYEKRCVLEANRLAARGHTAAKETFYAGGSELDIHLAYLKATGHTEHEMPYNNIVALDGNAAILHYMVYQTHRANGDARRSFLIDAGAPFNGYAADITRTYAYKDGEFAEMVAEMEKLELDLVDQMGIGKSYVDLHLEAHKGVGRILENHGFITMGGDAAAETGITRPFYPHGLGHFIGLQVHDVGGHQAGPEGGVKQPPHDHPFLRLTRTMEADQIFTVEPGLYFIDSLLDELRSGPHASVINWEKIDEFRPYGGIRIEDNIIVDSHGVRNLTRQAFEELE